MNFPSEVSDDATSLEEMEALVVMGGAWNVWFFLNLVTVSLPIDMNNQVLIKFLESPWIMLINTSWKHLAPGGGGREGGAQKISLRGGSAPRSSPLQFYLPF